MLSYLAVGLVSALCLGGALVAGHVFEVQPSVFYRDPAANNFAVGWLSNFGAVGWFIAAAILLFTASLIVGPERQSLLALGTLTLVLGIDDLFLVHEGLFPFVGLPGELLVAAYGIGTVAWLIACRQQIARTRWGLLAAAGALLGLSVALDLVADEIASNSEALLVAEDVLKLTGILFWALYGVTYARSVAIAACVAPSSAVGIALVEGSVERLPSRTSRLAR